MTFAPELQGFVSAQTGGSGVGSNAVIDWTTQKLFTSNSTYLARFDFISGVQNNFQALASLSPVPTGGTEMAIGADSKMIVQGPSALNNGTSIILNEGDFSVVRQITYDAPNFGGSGFASVLIGTSQYWVDEGPGNSIIPTNNRTQFLDATTWLTQHDTHGLGGKICAGPVGGGFAWQLSPDGSGTGPVYIVKVSFAPSAYTLFASISMASIDAAWGSQFGVSGICLDQTDGNILAVLTGSGGPHNGYLCKFSATSGALMWKIATEISNGGSPASVGQPFSQSSITRQRVGIYTGFPGPTATIYDTSNGPIAFQGKAATGFDIVGITPTGHQCYNDALGCIILDGDYLNQSGSPTLLNSTPTSWSDSWMALYVADAIAPPNEIDAWFALMGPVRPRA